MTLARAAAVPLLLLAAACGHLDEFNITRSTEVAVPGVPGSPPLSTSIPVPLPINRQTLEQEGIDPNDVDSARLVGLRIEVTEGTSFEQWLDDVAFSIGGPSLPTQLVAQRTGIGALPAGTTAVDLQTTGVDLKPYVLAATSTVTADVTGSAPAVDTTVRVTATIRVDVNVSGLFD